MKILAYIIAYPVWLIMCVNYYEPLIRHRLECTLRQNLDEIERQKRRRRGFGKYPPGH